jgi:murein DD-endopeptidase MepM/ murein hydrolase activator NlpD
VFNILRASKNVLVHIRGYLKFIFLLIIGVAVIIGVVSLVYRPAYAVTLNGEFIGYTSNKSRLQNTINEYMRSGDGENIAFVDIEVLPEFEFCLLKRDKISNEEEIIENIKEQGIVYYGYYAVTVDFEEKYYTKTIEEAEEILNQLREKKSTNIDQIAYTKVHDTELREFSETETVVADLFVRPVVVAARPASVNSGGVRVASEGSSRVDIGIALSAPTSGTISSRFGRRGGGTHTGLDIAGRHGTPIKAAAGGTVTAAGNSGTGYGIWVKISHGNGVETLYAHCSSVSVSVGQTVGQGEYIAAMGSTGNSTGSHLHFEVRVNGVSVNPQHYVY